MKQEGVFMTNRKQNGVPIRWIFIFCFSALISFALGGATWLAVDSWNKPIDMKSPETPEAEQVLAQQEMEVVLKQQYVCGIEEEERINTTVVSAEQLLSDYNGWELESQTDNRFVFSQHVHDLAPLCKDKGYFGLSHGGNLTLFEGPPEEDKVIKTFFQIDTEKLKSKLPETELELLEEGIRIKDMAEYHSILSTYGEFAIQHTDFLRP
jgi:forespore regulator of the sigma-K checkpoint